jgi:peptide deformylase
MAKLDIIIAPDPRLKLKCTPVVRVDAATRRLMDDMLETMYAAPGIGLAAPQVGVTKRIIVVDAAGKGEPPRPYRMADPEIVWASDEDNVYNEGCLSLPEHYADVVRPRAVRVRYLDHENELRELEADGLLATCVQHEMDHLDGVLFVDHISALKRNMILRKLLKAKRSGVFERDPEHAL